MAFITGAKKEPFPWPLPGCRNRMFASLRKFFRPFKGLKNFGLKTRETPDGFLPQLFSFLSCFRRHFFDKLI